jgi:hypothetical protein
MRIDILDERSDKIPNLLGAVLSEVAHGLANRSGLSNEYWLTHE